MNRLLKDLENKMGKSPLPAENPRLEEPPKPQQLGVAVTRYTEKSLDLIQNEM